VPGYQPPSLTRDSTAEQAIGWRGKHVDPTGNYYLGARSEYDPTLGRFTSFDPLTDLSNPGGYGFCGGDPVNFFDPDGRLGNNLIETANSLRDSSSVADNFKGMPYGFAGAILKGIGETPSVFSQAGQGMAQARAQIGGYTGRDAFLARSLMLPANIAFGTTKMVADPVNSARELPGGFVQLGRNILNDPSKLLRNPSVNAVFDVAEDAFAVSGLIEGAPAVYRSGTSLFRTVPPRFPGTVSRNATQLQFDFVNGLGAAPKPVYPRNNGFLGNSGSAILVPGARIDRFGSDFGRFASPVGTPFVQRSLPSSSASAPYAVFQVLKPFEVQAGAIAPGFGLPGGGIQYLFSKPVNQLISEGYLKPVLRVTP
jgi:RHS repeat-associated protein